jgi:hypothetical protein
MGLKIVFDNLTNTGTLGSSGTFETNLPLTNLAIPSRSKTARTTTDADFNITENFTESQYCSAFCITQFNFTTAATIRLRIYSGENQTGTLLYDSGVTNIYELKGWGEFIWAIPDSWGDTWNTEDTAPIFILFFDSVIFKSILVDISDSSNPDNYIEIGRMFYGQTSELAVDVDEGLSIGYEENTKQFRTASGTLRANQATPFRVLNFSRSVISDSEQLLLLQQTKKTGKRVDLLVSVYPDAEVAIKQEHTFIGKLKRVPKFTHTDTTNNKSNFMIEES